MMFKQPLLFSRAMLFRWRDRRQAVLKRFQSVAKATVNEVRSKGTPEFLKKQVMRFPEFESKWPVALFFAGWGVFWIYAWTTDLEIDVYASMDRVHPAHYDWPHKESLLTSFDHAALRRGFQVYREVCAACHSMKRVSYRHLIDVTHTEAELKAMAAEHEYEDGPNDQGEMFMRPGKITDYIVGPYANEQQARLANNGAIPPDLSNIVKGREGNENYIFSLLTGYSEPPAGVKVTGALNYNKYMPGSMIAMARNIYDEVVEYEDGTPASASQIAKDVTTFLAWASEPEHDQRQQQGIKYLLVVSGLIAASWYFKRHRWAYLKNKKIIYKPPKFKEL